MKQLTPWLLAAAFLVLLSFNHFSQRKRVQALTSSLTIATADNKKLATQVNQLGDSIRRQQAMLISDQHVMNVYSNSLFAIKTKGNTQVVYQQRTVTRIDTVLLPFTAQKSVPYVTDTVVWRPSLTYTTGTAPINWPFSIDTTYYKINGAVRRDGVELYTVQLSDTVTGRFIEGKKRLFHERPIEYQVMNTNPHVSLQVTGSAVYQPPKKHLLAKAVVLVAAGVVAGWLAAH